MEEFIDVFDENGNVTGETSLKSKAHRFGLWHTSVDIWLYTKKGEILIQKRAKSKDTFPNCWDVSVAGHVVSGEEPIHTVQRELEEELGISIQVEQLEFLNVFKIEHIHRKDWIDREFHNVYVAKLSFQINDLKLQVEEVADVKLISLKDLFRFCDGIEENFVTYPKDYINMVYNKIKEN